MTIRSGNRRMWTWVVCLGLLGIASVVDGRRSQSTTEVVALSVPGRINATPSIAAFDQFVIVVWGASAPEGGTDVYRAVSRDGGRTFGAPARVNDVAGDARMSGEQPPHVALIGRIGLDPVVHVIWTSRRAAGTALLRSQSPDGGRSFSPATIVPGTDAPGNRGWEAMAADRTGRLSVAWLDHREVASPASGGTMTHADHAAASPGAGTEAAQKSKLYVAALDGSARPHPITGGVCYCCKTAMAIGRDGTTYVAWRHVYPGGVRDIALVASRDGGKTFGEPARVSRDEWALNGCPENGPALALDDRNGVHVAWPTMVAGPTPTLALFYAMSADGRTFGARRRIPTSGTPSHVGLALDPQAGVVLVWDELRNGTRQIMMSRRALGEAAGEFNAPTALSAPAGGSYPVAASVPGALLIAWTSGGGSAQSEIRVRRLPSHAD